MNNPASYIDPDGHSCDGDDATLVSDTITTGSNGATHESVTVNGNCIAPNVGMFRSLLRNFGFDTTKKPAPVIPQLPNKASATCVEPSLAVRFAAGALSKLSSLTGKVSASGISGSAAYVAGAGVQVAGGQAIVTTTVGTAGIETYGGAGVTGGFGGLASTNLDLGISTYGSLSGYGGSSMGGTASFLRRCRRRRKRVWQSIWISGSRECRRRGRRHYQKRCILWGVRCEGGTYMLDDQIATLGSRAVWLFGRITSLLILIPPLVSFLDRLLPTAAFIAVYLFWMLMLFQMRGWSYGQASPIRISYVSWIKRRSLLWAEIGEVSSSPIGIRIQQDRRYGVTHYLIFNRFGFPTNRERLIQRQARIEMLQRWWINQRNNQGSKVGP